MWNCVENLETLFAAFKLRAVPFNVNFRYRETELPYIFKDAKPDVIVFDPLLSERITAAKESVGLPMHQDLDRPGRHGARCVEHGGVDCRARTDAAHRARR